MGKEAVNSEGQVLVRRTDYDYYIRYQNSGGVNLTRASYRAEVKGLLSNNDDTMSEDYHMQTKEEHLPLITFRRPWELR